ncbi:MAG: chloride channel protein [Nannocystaceae bacterium]
MVNQSEASRPDETTSQGVPPPLGRLYRLWSRLGLALGHRMAMIVRDDHVYLILLAGTVGVLAGAAAALLLTWIEKANALFPQAEDEGWLRWLVLLGVPVLGGLLVGALRYFTKRYLGLTISEGVPAIIAAISKKGDRLVGRSAPLLGVGSGLTIGSGGSAGHEGPTVTIGATVGSVLGRFVGLRERRQVALTGSGCAAGLAAAFNAPLAGVIFTVEVVFGRSIGGNVGTMSVFTPLIVAAVAGTFTSHAIFGGRPEFDFPVAGSESVVELVFYVLLAVIAGVVSPMMSRAVVWSTDLFNVLRVPAWLKPAIGGLGVGVLGGLVFTDLLGSGRTTVGLALQDLLTWKMALGLIGLKIVTTSLTIGSGGMGGFFMPSLFVGACIGTVVQALASFVLGEGVSPVGAYAMVGMGAYLGATLRAPVTSIVMIFELTQEYSLILPLMTGCILSAFIARRVQRENLYQLLLRQAGIDVAPPQEVEAEVMKRGRVADLMIPAHDPLRQSASLHRVKATAFSRPHAAVHVVDHEGRVVGAIDTKHLAERLVDENISSGTTASDLVAKEPPTLLYENDTLAGAMVAFARSFHDVLPVVTPDLRLVGLLRRQDLLGHYEDHVLLCQEESVQVDGGAHGPDQEVGLGKGLILDRVVVGERWRGRTLAKLALRDRLQVTVIEWRRGEELLAIDPHRPLLDSDTLAMVGTRDSLLRVRWLK